MTLVCMFIWGGGGVVNGALFYCVAYNSLVDTVFSSTQFDLTQTQNLSLRSRWTRSYNNYF